MTTPFPSPTAETTRATVDRYFAQLRAREDWTPLLSPEMFFISRASPERRIDGRDAYVQATKRFFAMIADVEVRDLLVDGNKACALTRYRLRQPSGAEFQSDVAEVFSVRDGKIDSLAIYFDTSPYPK
jgi:ketosteroid isomerase-like protein